MACICGHGLCDHYLECAGPGVVGCLTGKCLAKDCKCKSFVQQVVVIHVTPTTYSHVTFR